MNAAFYDDQEPLNIEDPNDAAIIVSRCLLDTYADDARYYREGLAHGLRNETLPIEQRVGNWLLRSMQWYHQSRISGHEAPVSVNEFVRALLATMGPIPAEVREAVYTAFDAASSTTWLPPFTRMQCERYDAAL